MALKKVAEIALIIAFIAQVLPGAIIVLKDSPRIGMEHAYPFAQSGIIPLRLHALLAHQNALIACMLTIALYAAKGMY